MQDLRSRPGDWELIRELIGRYLEGYDTLPEVERLLLRSELFTLFFSAIQHEARHVVRQRGSAQITKTSEEVVGGVLQRHPRFTKLLAQYANSTAPNARAYYVTVLRNQFTDWLRKNGERELTEMGLADEAWQLLLQSSDSGSEISAIRGDYASATEREVEKRRMLKVLSELPSDVQQILFMRTFDEQSLEECAKGLGCSIATVKRRHSAALVALREGLLAVKRESGQ
jgi:RNA polymerase sigma factor (sigma-70 family)